MSAGSKFVPAAPTIGMLRDERMSVRFRLPGTTDTIKLVLVPKSVRARDRNQPAQRRVAKGSGRNPSATGGPERGPGSQAS